MQGLSTKRHVEGSPKSWAFVNPRLHDVSALVLLAHGHPSPQGPGTKNTTIAMLWLTVGTWWDMVIVYLWCSQVLPGICHRVWKLWAPWYHGRCVLHPCWGDMDMVGFPPEAKLLSEEGIGAWSLDGPVMNNQITRHPKIEAKAKQKTRQTAKKSAWKSAALISCQKNDHSPKFQKSQGSWTKNFMASLCSPNETNSFWQPSWLQTPSHLVKILQPLLCGST